MFRDLSRRELIVDLVFAAVFAVVAAPWSLFFGWPGLVVSVAMTLAMILRRLSPAGSLALAWAGVAVQLLLGLPPIPANAAILCVLYATAAYGSTRVRWIGFASGVVGSVLASAYVVWGLMMLSAGSPDSVFMLVSGIVAALFTLMMSWTIGVITRSSRDATAQRRAGFVAEENRRRAEKQAIVEQERNRIARDMHDVVAHSLAVVIAQADGARYMLESKPELVGGSLETISETARGALVEVRVLLAELRHAQPDGPQPGVGDIAVLVEQMRGAGVDVRASVTGTPIPTMPQTHQIALYRIVQEALTNALRHGDLAQPVPVSVVWRPDGVEVRIENAVRHLGAASSSGHGVPGMRERAVLAGGQLVAQAMGPHRFVVSAFIPAQARQTQQEDRR